MGADRADFERTSREGGSGSREGVVPLGRGLGSEPDDENCELERGVRAIWQKEVVSR